MARASVLEISESDRIYFESLVRSRTMQAQIVQRARIILLKADGNPIDVIADKIGIDRKNIMLCIKEYKAVQNTKHTVQTMRCMMLPGAVVIRK